MWWQSLSVKSPKNSLAKKIKLRALAWHSEPFMIWLILLQMSFQLVICSLDVHHIQIITSFNSPKHSTVSFFLLHHFVHIVCAVWNAFPTLLLIQCLLVLPALTSDFNCHEEFLYSFQWQSSLLPLGINSDFNECHLFFSSV